MPETEQKPQGEKVRVELASEQKKHPNIYAALSAFQGELKPMAKTGKVSFEAGKGKVEFAYTPLGEIMSTIYPLLSKHGLSVRHEITEKGVEAILTHETYLLTPVLYTTTATVGERNDEIKELAHSKPQNEIRSGIVAITKGAQMKDTGAAITYARRYSLTMVLGISSEDDKDAELLEQSGKNAIQYAEDRARKGITEAKTADELDKAVKVFQKELKLLEAGKAGALGLTKEIYEELIAGAEMRREALSETTVIEGE